MPRPLGSQNRRTMLAGRNLAALARTYTEEALKALVDFGRGDIDAANAHINGYRPGASPEDQRRQRANRRRIEREQPIEASEVPDEPPEPKEIPWTVRLAAWIEVLNRGYGKPFQSVQVYDEHDVQITFRNPEELRRQLIEQGVPAALLPPPPRQAITIDADAVREEVRRDNQNLRRSRSRSPNQPRSAG